MQDRRGPATVTGSLLHPAPLGNREGGWRPEARRPLRSRHHNNPRGRVGWRDGPPPFGLFRACLRSLRDRRFRLAHRPFAYLALIFVACHPVLPMESRVALTLRLLGGLSTEEIARAFLLPPATIGQRISPGQADAG